MNTTWRTNNKTHKKKRVISKPKIRWEQLGFSEPEEDRPTISMEEIRREIVLMSSRGLGQHPRSRNKPSSPSTAEPQIKRRRGATE